MSELQSRKMHKEPIQKPTISAVKASGDAVHGKSPAMSKSKNVIPKSLRYDLENALVGLCDVWFEEIKPYLVRNNIKLHVHKTEAGDFKDDRERYIHGAPGCFHLDPGRPDRHQRPSASYVDSCLMPQTASKALYRRPLAPLAPVPPYQMNMPKSRNYEKQTGQRTVKRRTRKPIVPSTATISQSRYPVRRLCQSYSTPEGPSQRKMEPTKLAASTTIQKLPTRNKKKPLQPQSRQRTKDASTQTGKLVSKKSPKKGFTSGCQFDRCPATTTLSPNKNKKDIEDNTKVKILDTEVPLFQNDLIAIIGEKHDKMLKVLYKSSDKDYPSSMNLFTPTSETSPCCFKVRPWR